MEVLLTHDVENLGMAGEIHKVSPGFARNYLIPKKLAVPATAGAKKQADQVKRTAQKRRDHVLATARGLAARIEAIPLQFQVRVGERGRLYGSVTGGDISDQLSAKLGETVEKRQVALDEPIKMLGDYSVGIRLGSGVVATIPVTVIGENGETAADYLPKVEAAPEVTTDEAQPTYTE